MSNACPKCGADQPSAAGFCGRCGEDIPKKKPVIQRVSDSNELQEKNYRQRIYAALSAHPKEGITSSEATQYLPVSQDGDPPSSTTAARRLQELWEQGVATVRREHGVCAIGVCRPWRPPNAVHRPQDPCKTHGKPQKRGNAAIWVLVVDAQA